MHSRRRGLKAPHPLSARWCVEHKGLSVVAKVGFGSFIPAPSPRRAPALFGSHHGALTPNRLAERIAPGASPVIHVLVVSEITLYRQGLADSLGRHSGSAIEVIGAVSGPAELPEAIEGQESPDIILLDMSGDDALGAVRRLLVEVPDARLIAITVRRRESDVIVCAEAGVAGFVTAEASLKDLVAAIESASRGEILCSPRMTAALWSRVAKLARQDHEVRRTAPLTAREREVIALIDEGLSNKEIASRLYIELATVKNHVHHILDKLGVKRRAEAAALVHGRQQ
jgi:two-component system nitrate/nitrite response regulator NarL